MSGRRKEPKSPVAGAGELAIAAPAPRRPETVSEAAQHAWQTLTTAGTEAVRVEYESQIDKIAKAGADVVDIGKEVAEGYRELRIIPESADAAGRSLISRIPRTLGTIAASLGGARLLLSLPGWISTIASGASSWGIPIVQTALGSNPIGMAILMSLLILFNFDVLGISTKLQNAATLENTKEAVKSALVNLGLSVPEDYDAQFEAAIAKLDSEGVKTMFGDETKSTADVLREVRKIIATDPELFWRSVPEPRFAGMDGEESDEEGGKGQYIGESQVSMDVGFGSPESQSLGVGSVLPAALLGRHEEEPVPGTAVAAPAGEASADKKRGIKRSRSGEESLAEIDEEGDAILEEQAKEITKKARKGGRRVTRKHKKHSAQHKRKSATRKHKKHSAQHKRKSATRKHKKHSAQHKRKSATRKHKRSRK